MRRRGERTATANGSAPRISVIIPSYDARATVEACLRSLEAQEGCPPFEVIFVDSSRDGTADLVAARFPAVRLERRPGRVFPGDACNIGVSLARGEMLAFTGADCRADPGWLAEIARAHEDGDALIGGVIDNGNPESYVGWAYCVCTLSPWRPGSPAGEMAEIPTGCLSVKRKAFEAYGPFLEGTFSSDTVFNWRAAAAGHRPRFVPSIRVWHDNVTSVAEFVERRVGRGRAFARVRVAEGRFSTARRLALAALSPLLPALLLGRMVRRFLGNRTYVRQLLLASPLVVVGLASWSLGEMVGYLRPSAGRRSGA